MILITLKLNDILSFFLIKFWWLIPIHIRIRVMKSSCFNIIVIVIKKLLHLFMSLKRVLKTSYKFIITLLIIPRAPLFLPVIELILQFIFAYLLSLVLEYIFLILQFVSVCLFSPTPGYFSREREIYLSSLI